MKHLFALSLTALSLCFLPSAWTPLALAQNSGAEDTADNVAVWDICNQTSFILQTAIGFSEGDTVTTQGWIRIRPGECHRVDAPDGARRFVYAKSSDAYQGGIREWAGSASLCVHTETFDYPAANPPCEESGQIIRKFMVVSAREAVTRLVEPDSYGRRAQAAAIQRLLRDSGYDIARIDGVVGRRTNRVLAQALRDKTDGQARTPEEQIDALEIVAREFKSTVGVKVCNKTSLPVWLAFGRRHLTDWRSDGWWRIAAQTCRQAFSENLTNKDVHILARQEQTGTDEDGDAQPDAFLRVADDEGQSFCAAESRFAALGREDCAYKGYLTYMFKALPIDQVSVSVDLTDADFKKTAVQDLRR